MKQCGWRPRRKVSFADESKVESQHGAGQSARRVDFHLELGQCVHAQMDCPGLDDNLPKTRHEEGAVVTLTLEELLPQTQAWSSHNRVGRLLFHSEACLEMLGMLQQGCCLSAFSQDISMLGRLHVNSEAALATMELWDQSRHVDEVRLYTDGSHLPGTSHMSWSIVAIVRCQRQWLVGGFISNRIPIGDLSVQVLPCSHIAEIFAMLYALVVTSCCEAPVSIVYDCVSAAHVTQFATTDTSVLSEAAVHLAAVVRLLDKWPEWRHVRSHTGDPFNELADVCAKRAVNDIGSCRPPQDAAIMTSVLNESWAAWLWLHLAARMFPEQWPVTLENGALHERDHQAGMKRDLGHMSTDDVFCTPDDGQKRDRSSIEFSMQLVTYNCLSLLATGQVEMLDTQFDQAGCCVVGLQETRVNQSGPAAGRAFVRFGSPSIQGREGCQLWFSKTNPVGYDRRGQAVFCDLSSFTIQHEEERILAVTAKAGSVLISCISAHARTSVASTEDIRAFWHSLGRVIDKMPDRSVKVLCIDANAHFDERGKKDNRYIPLNLNAELFQNVAMNAGLAINDLWDLRGEAVRTWVAPNGVLKCLDYVAAPVGFRGGLCTQGAWRHILDRYAGVDHFPLAVTLKFQLEGTSCQPSTLRFDVQKMSTPQGRKDLQAIFQGMPTVAWEVHASKHWLIVKDYLQRACAKTFPKPKSGPRKPFLDDAAWQAVSCLHALRDVGRSRIRMHRRQCLHVVFTSWKHVRGREGWERRVDGTGFRKAAVRLNQVVSLHWEQLCQAKREVRQHMTRCKAQHAKQVLQTAREQGPKVMSRYITGLMKTGRRYRPPRVLPPLQDSQGKTVADRDQIHNMLGEHFAKAEKAEQMTLSEYRRRRAHTPAPEEVQDAIPTLAALAHAFRRVKADKAPGPSGLVGEIFRNAPQQAAIGFYSLFLKLCLRAEVPEEWLRSLIAVVPKKGKNPCLVTGWRSIALQEIPFKAACVTMRKDLVAAFDGRAGRAQLGGRPGGPLAFPALLVQCHLRRMARLGKSAAVIFVDGVQAFYSVYRELVIGVQGADESPKGLIAVVEALHESEEIRQELMQLIVRPSILEETGVPPAIRTLLKACLTDTFFQLDADSQVVYKTSAGSMPGSPLADIIYQLAMIRFQEQLRECLRAEGLQVVICASQQNQTAASEVATWVDDLAIPVEADKAQDLMPRVVRATEILDACINVTGVSVNYSEGKTEAVVCFRGEHSRRERHRWMNEQGGWAPIKLRSGDAKLRLTHKYLHLGSLVREDGCILDDIKHRLSVAKPLFSALRKRVLFNPCLTVDEKRQLVLQGPFSSLLHGAGLWVLSNAREQAAFGGAYLAFARQCLRPLIGFSSRGLTDFEICMLMRMWTPEVALRVHRLRVAIAVSSWFGSYEVGLVVGEKIWLEAVLGDLAALNEVASAPFKIPDSVELQTVACLFAELCQRQGEAREALRSASRLWAKPPEERTRLITAKAKTLTNFFDKQGELWHEHAVTNKSREACTCPKCGAVVSVPAALASHRRKVHGVCSLWSCLGDFSSCPRCMVEFWCPERLWDHLRKQKQCRASFEAADYDLSLAPKKMKIRACVKPSARIQGPRTLWAGMGVDLPEELPVAVPEVQEVIRRVWHASCAERPEVPSAAWIAKTWQHLARTIHTHQISVPADFDTELQLLLDACRGVNVEVFGFWCWSKGSTRVVVPRDAMAEAGCVLRL